MLKKRVIANLVVRNGVVVQSIGFRKYLPIGKPEIAIEFLNQWGIDEIILTDISASAHKWGPDFKMIRSAGKKCFVPLAVGGGITHIDHIKELLQCGADKICLNQAAIYQTNLITEAAHVFGNQCVVVSIDGKSTDDGYRVFDYLNNKAIGIKPGQFAHASQELGAGEILINSVDRDGLYLGYDLELINEVCANVTIPIIACGGAKNANDMMEVFTATNASAAAAGNFFHFTEHSVNTTKARLKKELDVRIETHADYAESLFDDNMRILKKEDKLLELMMYVKIEKEIL